MPARRTLAILALLTVLVPLALAVVAWWRSAETSVWTDHRSLRVPHEDASPRAVIWRPAEPVPGARVEHVDEYEPKASPDGATLVFVRRRPASNADLVQSRWTPDGWTAPTPLVALNSDADELNPEFAADGHTIWFASNRAGGAGGYDLWFAKATDDGWGAPVNAGANVNTAYDEYAPALLPDASALYFASDRPRPGEPVAAPDREWTATMRERRGRRDHDLYVAQIADAMPQPARRVDSLSTRFDEGAPAVSPAGDFLYFASDRPGGRGGFDVWRARLVGDSPRAPEPLDGTVNTSANELDPALASDGFRLYFSSDRPHPGDAARDPLYALWWSSAREVELERGSLRTGLATSWSALWPWLLVLAALLAILLLLLWLLAQARYRDRLRRLSLLAKCLLASALVHALIALALAAWTVGTKVGEAIRAGGTRVVLASSDGDSELARQVLAPSLSSEELVATVPLGPIAAATWALPHAVVTEAGPVDALPERLESPDSASSPLTSALAELALAPSPQVHAGRDAPLPALDVRTPRAERPPEAIEPPATSLPSLTAPAPMAMARTLPPPSNPPPMRPEATPPRTQVTDSRGVDAAPDVALPLAATDTGASTLASGAYVAAPDSRLPRASRVGPVAAAADVEAEPDPNPLDAALASLPPLASPAAFELRPPTISPNSPPVAPSAGAHAAPVPATRHGPSRAAPGRAGDETASLALAAPPDGLPAGAAHAAPHQARLPDAPAPRETFGQRAPESRGELVESFGGSAETERAVAQALEWFRRAQSGDGRWSSLEHEGDVQCDTAMTGLALLSFLGAGHAHLADGPYRDTVARGIAWLLGRQRANGDLRDDSDTMFGQTIGAVALCEAYAMTQDPELAAPARRATEFVLTQSRSARGAGSREPRDVAVLGWLVMTAESSRRAGFDPSPEVLASARRWLDSVAAPDDPGLYAYGRGAAPSAAMTAEAMFVQQLLGRTRDEARMRQSAEFLGRTAPQWTREAPTHSWYYTTLALFQHQGEEWRRWNESLAPLLVGAQRVDGTDAGSWDPQDRWSRTCGRVYQTAICTLSLEVYYRYRVR